MNVASLELCKELSELVEGTWADTYLDWFIDKHQDEYTREPEVGRVTGSHKSEIFDFIPAYDLGYLLRKLDGFDLRLFYTNQWRRWHCADSPSDQATIESADTPEDACAKLCIELIKQDVIKVKE